MVCHGAHPDERRTANNAREARELIQDAYGDKDGLLLLDMQNRPVVFLSMTQGLPLRQAGGELVKAAYSSTPAPSS